MLAECKKVIKKKSSVGKKEEFHYKSNNLLFVLVIFKKNFKELKELANIPSPKLPLKSSFKAP